ncbi:bifunctional TH2 protein, mitochondrial-like [Quercus lobata]|uniref:Thiaminase-2/PQQC domain-containing protein n=1 Tax=Quercus lobata TaxID=97700 RepID=A0A7N2RB52_QUELO|nr:bifunctional TH2 protein, mitochondrial-like [Quercus lobata]
MVGGVVVGVGVGVGPVVAMVDEGGLGKRFWIKVRNDTAAVLYSPFFVSLASGHLLPETFRHCISQDVHFLRAYAQAYEMAENCADDDEDKSAIRRLRKRVLEKLKAHPTLVQEWGFELPDESIPISATVKYTDFLLAAASGRIEGEKVPGKIATPFERTKIAAYTLAALGPCMRLYAYISSEIQALLKPDDSNHLYKKWIDSYSSQNFEASALQIEEMLDKLSISLTGEELEVIEKLYHQAMKLEVDFFSTLPISQKTVVPLARVHDPAEHHLTIFCDFDLTCTAFDSSAILAEMAIITAPKADSDVSETQLARMSSADLRNSWGALSAQYTEEFEQCVDSMMDSKRAEKFDYEGLHKALEQVAEFEKRANTRVIESGVLKGLNLEDMKRAGQRLILQDGCRSFFQKIVKNDTLNTDVHVLSYCWCGDLIRSAFSSGDLDELKVHSNELTYEESVTTGGIDKKVESPMEKLQGFNEILNNCNSKGKQLTVYIGGAVGDLLCMLQADVGIVFGSSSSLRKLGDHFGVSFVPLFSGLVKKQRELVEDGSGNWKGLSGTLYTVSSWAEIHAFILGS